MVGIGPTARRRILADDPLAISAVVFAVSHQDEDLAKERKSSRIEYCHVAIGSRLASRPQIAPAWRKQIPSPRDADVASSRSSGLQSVDGTIQRRLVVR